jgi:GDP-mannose 6-dehydrogenase
VVRQKRLRATCDTAAAIAASELALICVGTPPRRNGQPDFSAVARVAEQIGGGLRNRIGRYTVVLRSTVLPGTTSNVLLPALRAGMGAASADPRLAVNPEFMREGSSLRDFVNPPLTLVGCEDDEAAATLRALYMCVNAPFVQTGIAEAEMAKYVSNAFHAVKVCFANEIGDLCTSLGADAQEVTRIFLMDRKLNLSEAYLRPGFAFGGSCLPKDVAALVQAARAADLPVPLLSAITPSNRAQIARALEEVLDTRRRRVGVIGLSFKAGTDDLRESPMVALVEALIGKGCDVRIFDRNVSIARLVGANRRYIEEEIPHVASLMCADLHDVLAHAEVLILGNNDDDAARAAGAATDRHFVIDLTRRIAPRRVREAAPLCA